MGKETDFIMKFLLNKYLFILSSQFYMLKKHRSRPVWHQYIQPKQY